MAFKNMSIVGSDIRIEAGFLKFTTITGANYISQASGTFIDAILGAYQGSGQFVLGYLFGKTNAQGMNTFNMVDSMARHLQSANGLEYHRRLGFIEEVILNTDTRAIHDHCIAGRNIFKLVEDTYIEMFGHAPAPTEPNPPVIDGGDGAGVRLPIPSEVAFHKDEDPKDSLGGLSSSLNQEEIIGLMKAMGSYSPEQANRALAISESLRDPQALAEEIGVSLKDPSSLATLKDMPIIELIRSFPTISRLAELSVKEAVLAGLIAKVKKAMKLNDDGVMAMLHGMGFLSAAQAEGYSAEPLASPAAGGSEEAPRVGLATESASTAARAATATAGKPGRRGRQEGQAMSDIARVAGQATASSKTTG